MKGAKGKTMSLAMLCVPYRACKTEFAFWVLITTYRGTIGTRATLLSGNSWGSSSTHLASAASGSGITTVSFGSFFASGSRGSSRSGVALCMEQQKADEALCQLSAQSQNVEHYCRTYRGAGRSDSANSTRESSSTLRRQIEDMMPLHKHLQKN